MFKADLAIGLFATLLILLGFCCFGLAVSIINALHS